MPYIFYQLKLLTPGIVKNRISPSLLLWVKKQEMFWNRRKEEPKASPVSNCSGCNKRIKNFKAWESHARRCKKFKEMQPSYDIPVVDVEHLANLKVKIVQENRKEWGIWNDITNDWVRDKNGQIDSRLLRRNIESFLKCVTAESLLTDLKSKTNNNEFDV